MVNQKKLTFSALPMFAHGRSLRSVSPYVWRQIRAKILEQGCQCEICGAKPIDEADKRNFHVHEEWEFDTEHHILILKHMGLICHLCHQCDHIGLLQQKFLSMQITHEEYDAVYEHYAKVNQCSAKEATRDSQQAFKAYRSNPDNYSHVLRNAHWTYRLDCDFPCKDKMENALRKKGLLADAH